MILTSSTVSKLMVGSNAATKAYLGAVEVWSAFSPLDPIAALVSEFVGRTGATDTAGLYNLAEYLVAQSLWSNFVIYPMKSAQNVGSGSTVEPFGGLTSNDMTLVNSPTWGSGGIDFDTGKPASFTLPGLRDATHLTGLARSIPNNASSPDTNTGHHLFSLNTWYGEAGLSDGAIRVTAGGTGSLAGETFYIIVQEPLEGDADDFLGFGSYPRLGTNQYTWGAAEDHTASVSFRPSGTTGRKNGVPFLFNLANVITASTDISPANIGFVADEVKMFGVETKVAIAFVLTDLTDTQETTLHNLINAL